MNEAAALKTGIREPRGDSRGDSRGGSRRGYALIWIGTALALAMLSTALLWLVAPSLGPYAESSDPAPIHRLFEDPGIGQTVAALLQALVGAAASATGLTALFGRRGLTAPMSGIAIAAALLAAMGLMGMNGLVVAGYTLAYALPLLVVVLLTLAMRTPLARVIAALVGLAASALVVMGPTPLRPLYQQFVGHVAADPIAVAAPLVLVVFAGVWMLVGAIRLENAPGTLGKFVLRHRVAITVLAACCALPYVVARLSWLTPWPILGDPGDYDDAALTLANGLILGAAMLVGGVLTLGLVLPWGTRLPRFGPLSGRPVPVALAVVPASIVAVLFTAAGFDMLLLAGQPETGLAIPFVVTAVAFPFWLWGPLLALAAWGYALHRQSDAGDRIPHVEETVGIGS